MQKKAIKGKEVIPTYCTFIPPITHRTCHFQPPSQIFCFSFLLSFSFPEKPVLFVVNSYTQMVKEGRVAGKGMSMWRVAKYARSIAHTA